MDIERDWCVCVHVCGVCVCVYIGGACDLMQPVKVDLNSPVCLSRLCVAEKDRTLTEQNRKLSRSGERSKVRTEDSCPYAAFTFEWDRPYPQRTNAA